MTIKEREVQIQILTHSLEGIKVNEAAFLCKMREKLR